MEQTQFTIGCEYTRADIQEQLDLPHKLRKGGAWSTGYVEHEGDIFIFANVGTAGATGHDYSNGWDGSTFVWFGRSTSSAHQPFVKKLLSDDYRKLIFYRTERRSAFTFAGEASGSLISGFDRPIRIDWSFEARGEATPFTEEFETEHLPYYLEGASKEVAVNKYERSRVARNECLKEYGYTCSVCELKMEDIYGDAARDLIHVHHITPVSELGADYRLNPIIDLRPVCPNCHAVIHRRTPPYSISEVRQMIQASR